ncbi:ubiquitin thioesterase OTU1-like [Tropilaelaps mercedesae]|uniref:Ubiquitin thioesterase OTU n=1 Tax=Tropilaelaps mercedesae TaxID=418985 RepID=A0A1V9XRB2_9ACAR|nr:ubiquitin thioesterase OTU1-like [Tropilaelaps mercedesae]
MSSQPIVLRVRTKEGQHRIDCLTSDSTVADLKGVLLSLSGGSIGRVLSGYPPTALTLNEESLTLEQAHVRSGDTLIIVEGNGAQRNGAANAPAVASSPATDELNNSVAPAAASGRLPLLTNSGLGAGHFDVGFDSASRQGVLLRRTVPANNSCLFTSIHFSLSGGEFNLRAGATLRQIIADTVAADSTTYNEAFLGKPNREYCTWILNEEHWGGAIELAILSKHFRTEMVAVDTQNERLNRFGEDENYDQRILLIYDGIHYDPLLLEFSDGSGIRTTFSTDDPMILASALEVAHEAKRSGQFTDMQNFTLRCLVCNRGVVGQAGAQAHAKSTGHSNFGEVYSS